MQNSAHMKIHPGRLQSRMHNKNRLYKAEMLDEPLWTCRIQTA